MSAVVICTYHDSVEEVLPGLNEVTAWVEFIPDVVRATEFQSA